MNHTLMNSLSACLKRKLGENPPATPERGHQAEAATGPPTQATGPPRSGAGVGVGMLRGSGDSLT